MPTFGAKKSGDPVIGRQSDNSTVDGIKKQTARPSGITENQCNLCRQW
jgi:hypothetical protein